MSKFSKAQAYDSFIIAIRILLAFILISYGYGKLTDGQFGVSQQELNTPLKDLSLFRVSWYLADHEPFKSFIGISQIITAVLLIFRRTCIAGAFMALPIWLNILIWDISFMGISSYFTFRLSYYILLTCLVLYHYRQFVFPALNNTIQKDAPKFNHPVWLYALLPLLGIAIECAPLVVRWIFTHV